MANTGFKGINFWETDNLITLDAFLIASAGTLVTSTTTLALLELQVTSGTPSFKTYDWSSNTFKSSGMTTGHSTTNMTYCSRIGDSDATVDTGIFVASLATLTGFTKGAKYYAVVYNASASNPYQVFKMQFGSTEGDMVLDANSMLKVDIEDAGGAAASFYNSGGVNYLSVDVFSWVEAAVAEPGTAGLPDVNTIKISGTAQTGVDVGLFAKGAIIGSGTASAGGASTITLATALGTALQDGNYLVLITGGTGAGQMRVVSSYVNSTKVVTVNRAWITNPDNTSIYKIVAADMLQVGSAAIAGATGGLAIVGSNMGNVTFASGTDFSSAMKTSLNAATPTALLTPGTGTGQVTLASGVLTANANGDFTSTQKTSIATAILNIATSAATVSGSVLKSLVGMLADWYNAVNDTGTSGVNFTTGMLANAPSGSGLTAQQTADAVNNLAPGSTGATGSIRQVLAALSAGSGAGSYTIIQPVQTSLGAAMQNVTVSMFLSGDYYTAITDSSGNATFNLNAGTYAQSASYPGYTVTNNGSVVVSGNATLTAIVGTKTSISPAAPNFCTVAFAAYSGGIPATGVVFTATMTAASTGAGIAYVGEVETATSDGSGNVVLTLPQTAQYQVANSVTRATFTVNVPAETTYQIPDVSL